MDVNGIECRSVSVSYRLADGRENPVLHNINADFPAGQITLVTGPIGAGKSTLLHLLAGLMRPTHGEIVVDNQRVSRWISIHRDYWRRRVGFVFQLHHLFRGLSVLENVLVPTIPGNRSLKDSRRRAAVLLEKLGIRHLAGEKIRSLSGGERQRVSLARALVSRPAFVFADEPTAHQDDAGVDVVMAVMTEALEWNAVVVVAAHDPRVSDRHRHRRRYRLQKGTLKEPQ